MQGSVTSRSALLVAGCFICWTRIAWTFSSRPVQLQPASLYRFDAPQSRLYNAIEDATIATNPFEIQGLDLQNFERSNGIHKLILRLQEQIPALLTVPLTPESAKNTYNNDVRVLMGDAELVSSRDELINLNQVLVLVASTSTRASSFLFGSSHDDATETTSSQPSVKCLLGIDTNFTAIVVEWEVDFGATVSAPSKLQGRSLLALDSDTGKVSSHRLVQVSWNGEAQDYSSIGSFLYTSRQAVLGLQQFPILQPFLLSPILTQVRDDWMQQQFSAKNRRRPSSNDTAPPVFVMTSSSDANVSSWIPVNNYSLPFPGSTHWLIYMARQQAVARFCQEIIPTLAAGESTGVPIKSCFSPTARLYATDGSLLLQGDDGLANFYRSLATWRTRTFGSWTLERVKVLNKTITESEEHTLQPRIQIDYCTSYQIPGAGTPALTRGSDIYTLSAIDENDADRFMLLIEQVRQTKFSIGGSQQDGVVLMRSIAAAIKSGRFASAMDDWSIWMDLMKRFSKQDTNTTKKAIASRVSKFPLRRDRAALVVYRIMERLHFELGELVDPLSPLTTPLLREFMSDDIQLLGYLNETLLRGKVAYDRSVGLAMTSLRGGLLSGGVLSEKAPSVRVELTYKGAVKCSLTLHLKLVTPSMAVLPGMSDVKGATLPLELCWVSEYVPCPDTGKILQHRLLESRVNGQLTPGNVLSRWIQRLSSSKSYTGADDVTSDAGLQTIRDTLGWFRSLSPGA
jgi:hypothetical protein